MEAFFAEETDADEAVGLVIGCLEGIARDGFGARVAQRGSGLDDVLDGVALEGVPHCGIS